MSGRKEPTSEIVTQFDFKADAPEMMVPVEFKRPSVSQAKSYVAKNLKDYAPVTLYAMDTLGDEGWLPHSTMNAEGHWHLHENPVKL